MGYADCPVTVEQEVHWGDCVCCPPCAVFMENTRYDIKEGGANSGSIVEDSTFVCRLCIPPGARTMKSCVKIGGDEFNTRKQFQLGYVIPCCYDYCGHRPDIVVYKDESIVGSVQQPCCPLWLCKMQLDCYTGETRDEQSKKWSIKKCCCNCHVLFGKACGCCMEMCNHLTFDVLPFNGGNAPEVHKVYNGLINECCNMADQYALTWPEGGNNEKAIIASAVQFMDLMFFEDNF